ncbi:MAG: hypothetical protein LBJ03_04295 [Holosporales bacterium]|jgi:broad specificity phosphatase PhoE|nr:hypothetical protein [Holosporales bacterium]
MRKNLISLAVFSSLAICWDAQSTRRLPRSDVLKVALVHVHGAYESQPVLLPRPNSAGHLVRSERSAFTPPPKRATREVEPVYRGVLANFTPPALAFLAQAFKCLDRFTVSIDLLVSRHAPTQESMRGIVQGYQIESDVIPDQAVIYAQSLYGEFSEEIGDSDSPILVLQSPASRCRQTASLFITAAEQAFAERRIVNKDIIAARDIDIPKLIGRSRDDPEIAQLFSIFASNPVGFEHDGESGAFIAYCILFSLLGTTSDVFTRDIIRLCTAPFSLYAVLITHQVPMRALLDTSDKGIFDGVQTTKIMDSGSFWLKINSSRLRDSLNAFRLVIMESMSDLDG